MRIRDTVEENENMFEIHRLENVKIVSGKVLLITDRVPTKGMNNYQPILISENFLLRGRPPPTPGFNEKKHK